MLTHLDIAPFVLKIESNVYLKAPIKINAGRLVLTEKLLLPPKS